MSFDKIEPCSKTCPFLKVYTLFEDAQMAHCSLFDTPLVLVGIPRRCSDCLNADRRKAQYQAKKMAPMDRLQFWKNKIASLKKSPQEVSVEENQDRKEIKDVLTEKLDQFPALLDKATCQLLINLYLVLDSTEKSLMKDILNNPNKIEIFLKKIKTMGKNDNLLKNVRREMDEIALEMAKENQQIYQLRQNYMEISR